MNRRTGAWLIVVIGMIVCRGMFLHDVFYNIDEAEYAVAADALKQGELPGVDLLGSTKPPGIAVLYLGLFELFGRSLTVIHAASLVLMILMGWIVVETAFRLWGEKAFIPASLLFLMTANSFSLPSEMIALNVEIPGMTLAAGGLLLSLRAKTALSWFFAGMLFGLAILMRQSSLFFLLPMEVLLWYQTEHRIRSTIVARVGALVPWIIVLTVYAVHNGLGWAYDSWVRYPAVYASDVGVAGFFEALWMNMWEFIQHSFVPLGLAAAGKLIIIRNESRQKTVLLLSLALASFLALASGSRFFGHYFVQIMPVIALLGVPAWLWLEVKKKWGIQFLYGIAAVGLLMALSHFPTWKYWDTNASREGIPMESLTSSHLEFPIAKYIKENSIPEDRLAVWGYCPQIYFLAGRLPAVRDYMCHYITGYSIGSFNPFTSKPIRAHGHPDAEAMFLSDLQEQMPRYIVDLSRAYSYDYTFLHQPLEDYPQLNDFVADNYRVAIAFPHERRIEKLGGAVVKREYAIVYALKTDSTHSEFTTQ